METRTPIKVVHVIGGLTPGGAELVLARLLERMDLDKFPSTVISLTDSAGLGSRIEAAGIEVISIGLKANLSFPGSLFKLYRTLRKLRPDVVQAWMYHSNFLVSLLKPFLPRFFLIWNIRHTTFDPSEDKPFTIWIGKNARYLASQADRILCCSNASKTVHIELGYPEEKMVVIPNGYDVERYSPDEKKRKEFRTCWNIRENSILIGAAGRFHPQKDYRTFLNAASVLSRRFPRAVFILCGRGMDQTNEQLVKWIDEYVVGEQVRLLGEQQDMAAFYNGLDIFTLSASHGEAFPNVVSEAMSCGVPCVVTDVGDAALIVGKTGVVVPPDDPDALAAGWMKLVNLSEAENDELSSSARGRIVAHFSLETMVKAYENLYRV